MGTNPAPGYVGGGRGGRPFPGRGGGISGPGRGRGILGPVGGGGTSGSGRGRGTSGSGRGRGASGSGRGRGISGSGRGRGTSGFSSPGRGGSRGSGSVNISSYLTGSQSSSSSRQRPLLDNVGGNRVHNTSRQSQALGVSRSSGELRPDSGLGSSWNTGSRRLEDQENKITCSCDRDAVLLTVKNGPNTGEILFCNVHILWS